MGDGRVEWEEYSVFRDIQNASLENERHVLRAHRPNQSDRNFEACSCLEIGKNILIMNSGYDLFHASYIT